MTSPTEGPTSGARKVRLHRFHDTIAMAVANKDGYHTTVYLPMMMLISLSDQFLDGDIDISCRNFPQSTFRPRTIDKDGIVEFEA